MGLRKVLHFAHSKSGVYKGLRKILHSSAGGERVRSVRSAHFAHPKSGVYKGLRKILHSFLALVTSRDHVMYGDPYTYPPPSINTMNRRPGGGLGPAWTPFSGGFFIPRHVATLYQGPHLRSCGPAPCPERPAQCHHSRPAEGAACGRAFAVTFWCARPGHVQGTARALPPDRSPAWA